MLAIGGSELGRPIGKTIKCPHCGKRHKVKYADQVMPDGTKKPSKLLACYNCGESSYLCGINGFLLRPKKKTEKYF